MFPLGDLERLCLVHGLLPFPVGQWPRLNNAAPSLRPHYKTFLTTTGCSAPALRFGTLALAVGAARRLSLHAVGVTERRFSRSIRKPGRASRRLYAGCRLGSIRASPKLIPEAGSAPGFELNFRHFISGSLALASLNHACRDHVSTFPQRSPPSLFCRQQLAVT